MAWLRSLREESSPPVSAIRKRGRSADDDDDDAEESRAVRTKKELSRKEPVFRHNVRKMSAKTISSGRLQLRF